MARLYITKWVLARGILVTEAKVETPLSPRKQHAWVSLPGMRYARPLIIGTDAFLTLQEARVDAAERFRVAVRSAKAQLRYLEAGQARLGELLVHKKGSLVGRCHAFRDIGVHSSAGWIVDPKRLGREKP